MKSASLPYPVLVVVLVLAFAMMRCVGEYSQGQQQDARIEQHVDNHLMPLIPDCGRGSVMFAIGNDGIVQYWCGK